MPFQINVGGIWKTTRPFVNISGDWKAVNRGYVNVHGTWREFYASVSKVIQGAIYGNQSYYAKQSDHVELYAYNTNGGGGDCGAVTSIPFDLTGKSTVTFDCALEGQSSIRSDGIFIVSKEQFGGGGRMIIARSLVRCLHVN